MKNVLWANWQKVRIKSSPFNNRCPQLKKRWQLVEEPQEAWREREVFRLSRRLDLSYYLKRPHLQTEKLLEKLKRISAFLLEKEERTWASREERSLELFNDEKYLAGSGGNSRYGGIEIKKKWLIFFAVAILIFLFSILPIFPDVNIKYSAQKTSLVGLMGSMYWLYYVLLMIIFALNTYFNYNDDK